MGFTTLDIKEHIAIITYDRPPANAFNTEAKLEVADVFNSLSKNSDVRVVIFSAAGQKFFTGGSDINDFTDITRESFTEYQAVDVILSDSIRKCSVPVILAVEGFIAGLGFVIAAAADLIIAADNAKFMFPEIRVGIVGGVSALSALFPKGVARYLAYSGNPIPATELVQYGTVFKITPPDKLMEECIMVAKEIAVNYPSAVQYYKTSFNYVQYNPLETMREALFQQYTLNLVNDPVRLKLVEKFLNRNKK